MNKEVEEIVDGWPKNPQESAKRLIDHYGEPNEYSASQLIWYNTKDGWKRSVLSKEEVPHHFPAPHTDYLEQFIDYRVASKWFSPLAEYDGSVMAERTKGELSARCGGTSMNFVAINLAHDIMTGKMSVKEARDEYTRLYKAHKEGKTTPYAQGFQFELPEGATGDPDVVTLNEASQAATG
jgi:hypothetical protein